MIGIYKITNPKGCVYVGSSKEIPIRFRRYKKLQCKAQIKLYNSFVKYGVDNHIFEIIEECDINDLYNKEHFYGTLYDVLDRIKGLNLLLPGKDAVKYIISEENRIKRSLAQKGKKVSLATKIKMSKSQTGRKHNIETKLKMSLNNPKNKLIVNLETGIYYLNASEASLTTNFSKTYLKNMLNGNKKNKTSFIYV